MAPAGGIISTTLAEEDRESPHAKCHRRDSHWDRNGFFPAGPMKVSIIQKARPPPLGEGMCLFI